MVGLFLLEIFHQGHLFFYQGGTKTFGLLERGSNRSLKPTLRAGPGPPHVPIGTSKNIVQFSKEATSSSSRPRPPRSKHCNWANKGKGLEEKDER